MNLSDELFEQYRILRELLKQLINTDDKDKVSFLEFDLSHRIKYLCKLKSKTLKGGKVNERI